jgi:hypothetical protein
MPTPAISPPKPILAVVLGRFSETAFSNSVYFFPQNKLYKSLQESWEGL